MKKGKPLYLISDGGQLRRAGTLVSTLQSILRAAKGRVYALQLREQVVGGEISPATDDDLIQIVEVLKPECERYGIKLILNRNAQLAMRLGLDGVHVGSPAENLAKLRSKVPSSMVIGYSAHSVDEASLASRLGANYVFLGPVFEPISKDSDRKTLGPIEIRKAVEQCSKPVFALGGVSSERLQELVNPSAYGIAVIGSVLYSQQPDQSVQELLQAWDEACDKG